MAPPSPKFSSGLRPAQVKTDRGWVTDQGSMASGSIADRISAFNKLKGSPSTTAPAATPRVAPKQPKPLDKMDRQNKLLDRQTSEFVDGECVSSGSRPKRKKTKEKATSGKGMKRGLSADPSSSAAAKKADTCPPLTSPLTTTQVSTAPSVTVSPPPPSASLAAAADKSATTGPPVAAVQPMQSAKEHSMRTTVNNLDSALQQSSAATAANAAQVESLLDSLPIDDDVNSSSSSPKTNSLANSVTKRSKRKTSSDENSANSDLTETAATTSPADEEDASKSGSGGGILKKSGSTTDGGLNPLNRLPRVTFSALPNSPPSPAGQPSGVRHSVPDLRSAAMRGTDPAAAGSASLDSGSRSMSDEGLSNNSKDTTDSDKIREINNKSNIPSSSSPPFSRRPNSSLTNGGDCLPRLSDSFAPFKCYPLPSMLMTKTPIGEEEGNEDYSELAAYRDALLQRIAHDLLELDVVNRRLDRAAMRGRSSQKSGDSDMKETIEEIKESTKPQWTAKEIEVDEKEKDRGGGPGLRPLTPEHRHLLRMKAYSFPFLCEKSWNNCDDEDDDDGRGELVADESPSSSSHRNKKEENAAVVVWTDFIRAQETELCL